ncbi:MAG: RNA polymerase sigma factor [Magnetococcales bacterium]|nr:RNA polymerase sigma factor [Magnetococcales bacterium]
MENAWGKSVIVDPDETLVQRARAGDVQAYTDLVRKLRPRVFRFICRHVGGTQDAEDLTQETFVEVFRKLVTFQGNSRFSTWVLGIARNISLNHLHRSPDFRVQTTTEETLMDLPSLEPGPHERLAMNNQIKALRHGLDTFLTPELREAMVMVSLEGMSYQDAAALCNIPTGTMKTRVFRARKLLREGLRQEGTLDLFLS